VYEALDLFHNAYHTKIYKKTDKHSVHAKILFNMGQAYTDKGDDGLAMKSYDEAYKIL
jgi:cytochrome c-type biogenesis protein CcmH/NrfG